MKTYFITAIVLVLILFSIPKNTFAVEAAPRITDMEIIEGLADIRGDIKEIRADIKTLQQQIADLKEGQSRLEARIDNLFM